MTCFMEAPLSSKRWMRGRAVNATRSPRRRERARRGMPEPTCLQLSPGAADCHRQHWQSVRLFLSSRFKDQARDRIGLRYEGKVACLDLDRRRAHALGHEALEIGIDRAVFRRHGVPARL